jgi:putative RNA 2'-phosphotransferase
MHPKQLSKFLALVLRHQPQKLDLNLDRGGWADTEQLIQNMQSRGMNVDLDAIREVVATNNKQRFKLSEDGKRIRANQGHSIPVDLGLVPQAPPALLYHGTAVQNQHSILEKGLLPGKRQHVHLSLDQETARQVGQRHGKPIIFTVNTQAMAADGLSFYCSENGVWLTDHVPPKYFIQ